MRFLYEAMDRAGRSTRGSVEASSALEAADVLSQKGLFVESLSASPSGGGGGARVGLAQRFGASKSRLVGNFSRDLAELVPTGGFVMCQRL